MHDLVVKGGTIVDGTGRAAFTGDIAVSNGVITEVGRVTDAGARTIDADGLLVTPGFVDIHTHLDGQALWDPLLAPSYVHGVTTVVTGNCGVGFAPVRPDRHEYLIALFEGVEDIPGSALREGMPWGAWETFPEYLELLDRMPRKVDVGILAGHAPIRCYVMGERGEQNEPATPEDITRMADLVREAMAAGALGLSTSRTPFHKSIHGDVLPGTHATPEELFTLLRVLGEVGAGVIELSPDGSAGENLQAYEDEVRWMRQISAETGRPVTWGVVQYDNAPDHWRTLFRMCAEGVPQGARLAPQVLGRVMAGLIGHETTHPFMYKPSYVALADLPFDEKVSRLRDPDTKQRILTEEPLPPPPSDLFASLRQYTMTRLYPLGDPPEYEPSPEQSVGAIAQRLGVSGESYLYDAMLERGGHELFLYTGMNYVGNNLESSREMLLDPLAIVGLSDAGAHCGSLCDAGISTYLLTHWARDRSRGPRLPLELVVHKQTAATAQLFGMDDRGVLAPGKKADLNLIDFERLTTHPPVVSHDLPGGGRRLTQQAEGYVATLVSGVVTRENDDDTPELPGRLVRGAAASR